MVKLNLGSSEKLLEGFINVDINFDLKDESFLNADVRDLPFPDKYADYILARQVLEHIPITDTIKTLREWLRVLKPKGTMVITCPNFNLMAYEWLNTPFTPVMHHEMTQGIYGNQKTEYEKHVTPITPEFLNYCLGKAGAKEWNTSVYERGMPFVNYDGCVEPDGRVYRFGEAHIMLTKV